MDRKFWLFQNLVKNKHFRFAFAKYFMGTAAAVLVVVIIYAAITYNLYSLYLQTTVRHFHEKNLYKTSEFVDYVFENIEMDFTLIATNEDIIRYVMAPQNELPSIGLALPGRIINDLFRRTVHASAMDSIYIYSYENNRLITWTEERALETFADNRFLDKFQEGHHIYSRKKADAYTPSDLVTMVLEIKKDEKVRGVVAFNLNANTFGQYVNQGFDNVPENIYVVDENGNIFFSNDTAFLNTSIYENPTYSVLFTHAQENGSDFMYQNGHVISGVMSAEKNYTVLSSVQVREITDFRSNFIRLTVGGTLLGLIIAFIISVTISYRLYRNVIRLVSYVNSPSGTNENPEITGEATYITENITNLVARNKHIEHELAGKLVELKKAQGIALQNQINPHFILNTLQLVNLDIMKTTKGDTVATNVIAILSEILQSNLNTTNHIVPVSYEIKQAMKYIEIENIRNKGKFHAKWDVDEKLLTYRTVKFIIQPILENSIKHGLINSPREDKNISISLFREEKCLIIKISDNGLGMPPEPLSVLRKRLADSHMTENSHIGLCNVDKRIKLVFGDTYGVSVDSIPDSGTTVTIRQKLLRSDWKE